MTTLETDLAITKDDVVVISHDPRLNPDLTRGPDGQWITAPGVPIRSLTLDELKRYDIGRTNPASKYASQFPQQKPVDGQQFPTLAELYAMAGPDVRFNIEIKTDPTQPDVTLDPVRFTRLAVDAIRAAGMQRRTTIQSFDWRALVEAHRIAPEIPTSCLTIESSNTNTVGPKPSPWLAGLDEKPGGSLQQLAKAAGCTTWAPFWRNVTAANVTAAHRLDLNVIPWTVNDPAEMRGLIELSVDGLITDYPDRALPILSEKGLKAR